MKNKIINWLFKVKDNEEFTDASEAYMRSTYSEQYTKDQLRDKLIKELQQKIKADYKVYHTYVDISTYSGYREKQVLPEVAEYFRTKNYKVELHNGEDYKEINVLIISWQSQVHFLEEK